MKRTLLIFILLCATCYAEPDFVLVGMRGDISTQKKAKVTQGLADLGVSTSWITVSLGGTNWFVANFWRQQLNQTMTPEKFTAITNAVADSAKFFVVPTDDPQAVLKAKGAQ